MFVLDTDEKLNWFFNAIEDGEIILDNSEKTEEEWEEIRKEIAECKVMYKREKAEKELVFA